MRFRHIWRKTASQIAAAVGVIGEITNVRVDNSRSKGLRYHFDIAGRPATAAIKGDGKISFEYNPNGIPPQYAEIYHNWGLDRYTVITELSAAV